MAELTLELLGPPRVTHAGQQLDLRTRKVLALLFYLAVEHEHAHSREALLGLLWPEMPEEAARNNLRVALADLRRLLEAPGDRLVQADRLHVRLVLPGDEAIDVATFRGLLAACEAHAHAAPERCEACLARLAAAVELYRGDFLAGFGLPDSEPFTAWAAVQREQLHQRQLAALETLAAAHELRGDHAALIAYGRRQLALEPWRETAHAQVVRGLWAAGQRGAALEQYEACRRVLADELGLEPSPELAALAARLRDTPQGVGAWAEAPARRKAGQDGAPPHNLPAALTSLVGRERELEALAALLGRPDVRLLTLTGPGGIGKTRLALDLARRQLDAYSDGVFLVQLAPLRQPEVVAAAILRTLGAKAGGDETPEEALAAWLRDRHMLLVLDNFEHLLAAAALVGDLLAAAPGLTVLATSREALHIYGEQRFAVPPLALPPAESDPGRGEAQGPPLEAYAAVALFVQRLQAVRPDFTLGAENAPAVAALCARFDGLPLALELAAARGQRLSPQRMLEQLRHGAGGLRLLVGGGSDQAPRQQTIHAAIAWSYDLLSADEQATFCRLAVFVGGWAEEAAEAIVAAGEHLHALAEKSLVAVSEGADGAPRFTMLETIREYALERLEARGEAAALRERHAAFFMTLAEAAEPHLAGGEGERGWWDRLRAEEDNLRAALRWAIDAGEQERGLRLAGALWQFWDLSNAYREGRRWLTALLALGPAAPAPARARALNGLAMLALRQADSDVAAGAADESLALYRALGDARGTARALLTVGNVASLGRGDYALAAERYGEALALQRGLNSRPGVAIALFNLGLAALSKGDYALARDHLDEAQALYAELGSQRWLARIQPYLAAALLMSGDHPRAATLVEQTLTSWERGVERDLTVATQVVIVAAGVAEASGEPERAALLLGALDPLDAAVGASSRRKAAKQRLYATISAAVSARLDAAAFAAARAEGAALTTAQAVAAARATMALVAARRAAGPPLVAPREQQPVALTPLVGRERELEELGALLRRPETRLLTLSGPGGIGKTRLALQAAAALAGHYADGAWWVAFTRVEPAGDLATQADLVALTIASAWGRSLAGNRPLAELSAVLRGREALVVFDNCEHLPVMASVAQTLLEAAPRLRVLATSRQPLGVPGEVLLWLDGLAVPADDAPDPAAYPSVQLFLERAAAQTSGWRGTPADLAAVARLCRLLEGMPLGIELAACWAGHYTPAEIAAALVEEPDLLTARGHVTEERHRSLRAVFTYSWRLLAVDERQALARLSVFRGTFDREAALAVAGVRVPALAALVDASLLRQPGVGQYSLHELLRQFAAEELAALEPDGATRDRHATYYLALLARQEAPLRGPRPREALAVLVAHGDNIRQAWQHACGRRQWQPLAEAVHALALFYRVLGPGQQGLQLVDMASAQLGADQAGDTRAASPWRPLGAALLAYRVYFLVGQERFVEAVATAQAARAAATAMGDELGEALATLHEAAAYSVNIALHLLVAATDSEMLARLERAVDLCRARSASGDGVAPRARAVEAESLYYIGSLLKMRGAYEAALGRFDEAMEVCRQAQNAYLEARIFIGTAGVLEAMGRLGVARAMRERVLAMARSFGGPDVQGRACCNLAGVLIYLGDYAGARKYAQEAIRLRQEAGANYSGEAHTLSWACFHRRDYVAALEYAEQAIAQGQGNPAFGGVGLLARGDALGGLGRWAEAWLAYAGALDLGRTAEAPHLALTALAGLAGTALARGEKPRALEYADACLEMLSLGQPDAAYEPLRSYLTCYQVLVACGDPRAPEVLSAAHTLLMARADLIAEPGWRRSFLANVAAHRAIIVAAEQLGLAPATSIASA